MELQRVRHDLAIEQQQNNILPVGKKKLFKRSRSIVGLDPLLFIFWNKHRQGIGEAWNNFLTIFSQDTWKMTLFIFSVPFVWILIFCVGFLYWILKNLKAQIQDILNRKSIWPVEYMYYIHHSNISVHRIICTLRKFLQR